MKTENPHTEETVFKGVPASPGIAIGPVFVYHKHTPVIEERSILPEEVERELARLEQAVARSHKELRKILEFAEKKLGEDKVRIFEAQLMFLEDAILFDAIYARIRGELKNPEYIVHSEIEKYHRIMLASKDEYTHERANDVEDVRNRILRNLQEQRVISRLEGSSVIVSQNLTAPDTVILSRNEVLAYATDFGGITSHTALLSRALKIPAVVGLKTISHQAHDAERIVLDGYSGEVVLNPTEETIKRFEAKRERYREFEARLAGLRDLPAETLDHHRVELSVNVEFEQELEFIKLQGADGIGLYRSEYLIVGKEVFPTEEEQYNQYKLLAETMYPKRVIIRTFDIGGDKLMAESVKESNPFLGWRGIRVMLDKPDLFLEQLRAILRASTRKNVAVMFPMVSNLKEVRRAKKLLDEAKHQLRKEGISYDSRIKVGVMIEVPSAAVIAEDIAEEVDFLSIGTNDLIQYLLAVDRGNDVVSGLYQEFNPAVVRFLRRIIDRGKKKGVWVGMCGEMAGDPLATILLLGLGLDEFSVVPNMLPEIKKIIRSVKYSDAQKIAKQVLMLKTEDEIKDLLKSIMQKKLADIPID
ncbi:MAG: phosphoenolpyruvate--protein phosphotransferase [Ignavibacteriales bacterium]|nr:phosphoenolpyruvate--protein phosphotransferase [Ignavibacteriales bacterium]